MTPGEFYRTHTHPLILPLLHISWRGFRVDQEKRHQAQQEYAAKEQTLTAQLHALVGEPLDPHSPKQLMAWVYTKYGVRAVQRTRKTVKGEQVTTDSLDEDAIKELLTRAIPDAVKQALTWVLDIRETHKVLATYLRAPLDSDGRLRCGYSLTGTKTGRIASHETPYGTGTNLQNIPKGIARAIIIPDEGHVFVNADLSQAEARLVAYLAQETRLIEAFAQGRDVFREGAAKLFSLLPAEVTAEQRDLFKATAHGSHYGMGPHKFAQELGILKEQALRFQNFYFNTYPGIKRWHLEVADTVKRTRLLTTPLGRRRQFFGRWNDELLRKAYGFVPQSTVADCLNAGLVEYERERPGEALLQVHDSLLVQVPEAHVPAAQEALRRCLTRPLTIHGRLCTIPVTLKQGRSWDALA